VEVVKDKLGIGEVFFYPGHKGRREITADALDLFRASAVPGKILSRNIFTFSFGSKE